MITKPNFLIPTSFQPDGVNPLMFQTITIGPNITQSLKYKISSGFVIIAQLLNI